MSISQAMKLSRMLHGTVFVGNKTKRNLEQLLTDK